MGIAYNPEAPVAVEQFKRTYAPNFPVGYRDRVRVEHYLQLSPIMRNYVPNIVVIDRNWVIRAQYAGDDPMLHDSNKNLRALVDSLLKESASSRSSAKKKK